MLPVAAFLLSRLLLLLKLLMKPFLRQNSFLMTILGLGFLCAMLSSQARADAKGIPFNEQFQSASYPYARTVSGCSDWRRPAGMGDEWSGVSFAGACQIHDRCFHTLNTSWGDCNQKFQDALRHACDRDLEAALLASGKSGKPDGQAVRLCYEITNMYMARVQTVDAAKRFEFAQKQQTAYLDHVRNAVSNVYEGILKRPATPHEQTRALRALEEEYTLDDLKTALMGYRLDRGSVGESDEGAAVSAASMEEGY